MAAAIPVALKPIKQFMQRASEVERSDQQTGHVVAFYCKQYAMETAITLNVREQEGVSEFLLGLMDKLEEEKKSLTVNKSQSKEIVKSFALGVFKRADDEYRAGQANKSTARSFYAANNFLEVVTVFGGNDDEEKQMKKLRKYAKMKATEILLAVKQGKRALPDDWVEPAAQKEVEEEESEKSDNNEDEMEQMKEERLERQNANKEKKKAAKADKERIKKQKRKTQLKPRGTGGTAETQKAEEAARQAVRHLQRDELQLAANFLCEAISVLETSKPEATIDKNITPADKSDALEFVLFAVRSLECCGETIDIDDGIDLAVNHLSDALGLLNG